MDTSVESNEAERTQSFATQIMEAKSNKVRIENSDSQTMLIFNCPHCSEKIIVAESELACCIFRHAVLKNNMQQINPHASKSECDALKEQIYGCAGPFKITKNKNEYIVEICEYI